MQYLPRVVGENFRVYILIRREYVVFVVGKNFGLFIYLGRRDILYLWLVRFEHKLFIFRILH